MRDFIGESQALNRGRTVSTSDDASAVPFVDYRAEEYPNAEYAISNGMQLIFRFYKPMPQTMQRIAEIIDKVEANIDELRDYERDPARYGHVKLHTGTAYAPPPLKGAKKKREERRDDGVKE